jgi:hypothetical protein
MRLKISFTNVDTEEVLREETLSEEEVKAAASDVLDIPEYVVNAIKNKARQMVDVHVEKSGLASRFKPMSEKLEIIKNMQIESAADRQKRLEAKEEKINE